MSTTIAPLVQHVANLVEVRSQQLALAFDRQVDEVSHEDDGGLASAGTSKQRPEVGVGSDDDRTTITRVVDQYSVARP